MVSMNELKQDMITGMGYIGLDSGRLYRMRRGPKLIEAVASGTTIIINDAAEGRPFRGLRVFGRTEQVRTTGKNLLDLDRYFALGYDKYYNTITNLKNGTITVTNQNDGNGQISLKRFSELKIEAPFTLSAKVNKGNCYLQVIEVTNEGQHAMIYNVTNTTKSVRVSRKDNIVDYFMRLSTNVGNSEFEVSDIQIESGETVTPYEPYTGGKPSPSPEYPQEIVSAGESGTINVSISDSGSQSQSLTLQTPNVLPGVPVSKDGNYTDADGQQWICDEIDLGRGKYVQRVKEINPADYDRWILDKTTGNLRFKIIGTDAAKKTVRSEILSNRFTFLSYGHMLGGSFTYNSDVYFYLPSTVTTVEECKQWFVDNQTTIYYQLEPPIERDLTPEEIAAYKALRTYGPTTVVSNDAGAEMEVTYVADRKEN